MDVSQALRMARAKLHNMSESAGLDARLLLGAALGRDPTWLMAHPEAPLDKGQAETFHRGLQRYLSGEALPYILGWWEFYGRRFLVAPDVLIPRPETELMVETALAFLQERRRPARAVDIGTGSGCVAISLLAEIPKLRITAVDRSAAALSVARENALRLGVVDRISLVQADLMKPLDSAWDLVCANLPYIPEGDLASLEVAQREPRLALDGGPDGLTLVRRLLGELPGRLAPGGMALLEIGAEQGDAALAAARFALPAAGISLCTDLAGRDRLLVIRERGR